MSKLAIITVTNTRNHNDAQHYNQDVNQLGNQNGRHACSQIGNQYVDQDDINLVINAVVVTVIV